MKYLIAILALALLAIGSTAEAHGGRQFRQRVVVQQVVVQRHAFVQPIVVRQQFVQPIYSQQFVAPVYSQQFVQPVVVGHSCGQLFGY